MHHCGNAENAYSNNIEHGKINRRTPYWPGIPKTDMIYFNGNALYDSETHTWRCLLCNYTRWGYKRYQVFGHMAANRGYASRTPNERWGIQIHDEYIGKHAPDPPQGLKAYMAAEIDNRRIYIRRNENNEIKWECGYCRELYRKEKE